MIKTCWISDTHQRHSEITIPECDILFHTGDYCFDRGTLAETVEFFKWLERQRANHIVFIDGNHDLISDPNSYKKYERGSIAWMLAIQKYNDYKDLLDSLPPHIHRLCNNSIRIEGLKIWGSPISPTFGRDWAWNRDRGEQIKKEWARIPSDTNILLTHTPPKGILDFVDFRYKKYPDEDANVGCVDLLNRVKKLKDLKIHGFGHVHDQLGVKVEKVSNTRRVHFVNSAMVTNDNILLQNYPITLYL